MISPPASAPAAPTIRAATAFTATAFDSSARPTVSKISFGAETATRTHQWKRKPVVSGHGAVRVRTFHAKLSDQGLDYIDEGINVWLDEHPEIDIKFVTTSVGMFDGKFKDFALIVNVWY